MGNSFSTGPHSELFCAELGDSGKGGALSVRTQSAAVTALFSNKSKVLTSLDALC